jgi:hypothetical protein
VKAGEPSVSVDIYYGDDLSKYTTPGPAVAKLVSAASASDAQTSQTEGLRPSGCILENANWCGKEVPDYSDETGCWAAGENCWDQSQICYDTSPPTGNSGCELWQAKCKDLNNQCTAKNFNGPPNKGKDLTPKKSTIEIGLIMATQGGGVVEEAVKTSAVPAKSSVVPKPQSASAATSASVEKPKPTSTKVVEAAQPAPTAEDQYEEVAPTPAVTPKVTITVPASEDAPDATPVQCPAGYECVTRHEVVVETQFKYVTVEAPAKKWRGAQHRRHGHKF